MKPKTVWILWAEDYEENEFILGVYATEKAVLEALEAERRVHVGLHFDQHVVVEESVK